MLAFRRQYLPLADLAHAMGIRPSYLVDQLRGVEFLGSKGLPNGQRRGALLPLSRLGALAVKGCAVANQGRQSGDNVERLPVDGH
ncbi:hypothetical protein CTS44_14323 [Comamonas thiooxydans]|nr:hypothetical protein CTS44_14323 [Comamonas thiooxydans]